MMKKVFMLLILASVSTGYTEEVGKYQVLGRVSTFEYIDTQRREMNAGEQGVASVFGLFGALFAEVMTVENRAYYTYKISTEDDRIFDVASRTNYKTGDCIKVIYPRLPGGVPESGIDTETKLEASKECREIIPEISTQAE
jgi:hypothetical protein